MKNIIVSLIGAKILPNNEIELEENEIKKIVVNFLRSEYDIPENSFIRNNKLLINENIDMHYSQIENRKYRNLKEIDKYAIHIIKNIENN